MNNCLYTIGYTGFSVDEFLDTLKKQNINVVIDVRSSPYSERYADYNKDSIVNILEHHKIYYRNYAIEFGARQTNSAFYSDEGYLDFEVFAKSEQFLSGMKKICNSVEKGYHVVFLCAEKDPINCHRAILVARAFSNLGYPIVHLLPNGQSKTQQQLEKELLDRYFPSRGQMSIFSDENVTTEEYLRRAYREQNKKIGFRLEDEEG